MKKIVKPTLILISILVVLFTGHYFVVKDMNDNAFNLLLLTYSFNLGITLLILVLFGWAFSNKIQQLGSIFLMSTGAKFLLFFSIIYPFLKMNGTVKSFSFAAFFIPYAVCLTAEVLLAIRLMNSISSEVSENANDSDEKSEEN
ncbi:MAG: hypothetical protein NXI10_08255 [bacterium]|nr:hypothetical protein [bacterium]